MSAYFRELEIDLKELIAKGDKGKNSCANYFHFIRKDKKAKWTHNTNCHYALRNWTTAVKEDDVFVNVIQSRRLREFLKDDKEWEERGKRWTEYLVNRSPFAPAFLEKDVEEIWEDQAFVMDVTCNYNLFAAACIHTRRLWEYTGDVYAWDLMVERGVDENLATLIAHFVHGTQELSYLYPSMGSAHRSLDVGVMDVYSVSQFLKGLMSRDAGKEPFFKKPAYDTVSELFIRKRTKGGEEGFISKLLSDNDIGIHERVHGKNGGGKEGGPSLNPFEKTALVINAWKGAGRRGGTITYKGELLGEALALHAGKIMEYMAERMKRKAA